jgi:transposase
MGVERYVIEAVVRDGRSHREVARSAGVSKAWVTKLLARYRQGGDAALEPRSRRPRSCAHAASPEIQTAIVVLRQQLDAAGYDSGPHTIAHHLRLTHPDIPSVATIWRILKRHGLITAQPQKQPKSSYVRFEADLPNEMWQGDFTHWQLADGTGAEILNYLDDHSRMLMACDVFPTVKGSTSCKPFTQQRNSTASPPRCSPTTAPSLRPDHATARDCSSQSWNGLASASPTPGRITPRPAARWSLHQTLKRYLAKQPAASTLAVLQLQLDTFRAYYNHHRPHRALHGRTPLVAFNAMLKAHPVVPAPAVHCRVRHDRVSAEGKVTLRYLGRLLHIGIGRAYKHEAIRLMVEDRHVRILTEDGEVIRDLILDPTRNYQPRRPAGPIGHHDVRQTGTMS